MKAIKIFFLKRKVKSLYLKVREIEANSDYGNHALQNFNPTYQLLSLKLDIALEKLNKLDPKCPPRRNVNK